MKLTKHEMTRRVIYLLEEDDLEKAQMSMDALEVHHVPVVRNMKVVGMISDRDVLQHQTRRGGQYVTPKIKISDIMNRTVIACRPEDTISSVAQLMLKNNIHALPVIGENERLVGIITSTDLLRLLTHMDWVREERMPFLFEQPVHVSWRPDRTCSVQ